MIEGVLFLFGFFVLAAKFANLDHVCTFYTDTPYKYRLDRFKPFTDFFSREKNEIIEKCIPKVLPKNTVHHNDRTIYILVNEIANNNGVSSVMELCTRKGVSGAGNLKYDSKEYHYFCIYDEKSKNK
jgi:hypothetical protein